MRGENKATDEQKTKPRILLIIGDGYIPEEIAKLRKFALDANYDVTLVDYNDIYGVDERLLNDKCDIALTLAHGHVQNRNTISEKHASSLPKEGAANFITSIDAETHFFFSCHGGAARIAIEEHLAKLEPEVNRQVIIAAGTKLSTSTSDNVADMAKIITACNEPLSKVELKIKIKALIAEGILRARTYTVIMKISDYIFSAKFRGLPRGGKEFLEIFSQALGEPNNIEALKIVLREYYKSQGSKEDVSEGSKPKKACKITYESEEKKEEKETDNLFAEIDQAIETNIQSWDKKRANRFLQDLFWQACSRGKVKLLSVLLTSQSQIDINEIKGDGTALMIAAQRGRVDVVEALAKAKASLNFRNKDDNTAVMFAAYAGHFAIVEALLDAKANLDLHDHNGCTALMSAAYAGHFTIVEALIKAGADIYAKNNDGMTVLEAAEENKHSDCVNLLNTFKRFAVERLEKRVDVSILSGNKEKARQNNLSKATINSGEGRLLSEIITSFVNKICKAKDEKEVKLNSGMVETSMRLMQPKIRKLMGVIVQAANSPFRTKLLENFTEQQQDVLIKEITRCAHMDVKNIPNLSKERRKNWAEQEMAKGGKGKAECVTMMGSM
jgi:hypothetical protein